MQLISEKRVLLNEVAADKNELIKKMAKLFVEEGIVEDYEAYLAALFEREEISPTAVGYDVGLPHGKTSAVKQAGVAFARLANPILWSAEEEEDAKFVFMLAIPAEAVGNEHINILVELSKKILDDDFRELLANAENIGDIVNAINKE